MNVWYYWCGEWIENEITYTEYTMDTMRYKTLEPRRATIGSAGYDFYSPDRYDLEPGKWTVIDTEVAFTDDDRCTDFGRWFMAIFPRSGLSFTHGFRIINTVPIIDMDYRGTIKLKVTVEEPYTLEFNEKFAQGIILPFGVFGGEIKPETTRNGGFGSTGRM